MSRHFQPDDRHNITNPYDDPHRWAEDGHAKQIEQEVKRVVSQKNTGSQMEGMGGDEVAELMTAVESIKDAIVSAAKAAPFDFPKFGLDFGFGTHLYLEKKDGKLKRDGRPA